MNLSVIAVLVVCRVVVVPCTVKSPWIIALFETVNPENVGESPVCNPKSTSPPLTLTVPCDGDVTEPDTVPDGKIAETSPTVTVPKVTNALSPVYPVASAKSNAGVASDPFNATDTPPNDTVLF